MTILDNEIKTAGHKGTKEKITGISENIQLTVALIIIATVSFVTRVIGINYSKDGTPVFDEKHYAPHAWQMLGNDGLEDNPGYALIVHPPVGKMMISLGEMIFGYTPLGWRFTAIISSVVIIMAICWMVWRFTKSLGAVILAGVLGNTELIIHLTGRIGMLDIFLTVFITVGVLFIVEELRRQDIDTPWILRPWLIGAGIMFGLAMGVKVSGVLYPAVAGILMVITVAVASKSTWKTIKATGSGLVYFFVIPSLVFLASYLPWVGAENSVSRHSEDNAIMSFIDYQTGAGEFHTSLTTSGGHSHPWESKPWEWLVGFRPMLYYTQDTDNALIGADGDSSIRIWLMTNPVVWFLLVPVTLWMIISVVKKKDWSYGIALTGIFIGIVPWMIFYDRTMYLFYVAALAPFLIIAVTLCLRDVSSWIAKKKEWNEIKVSSWIYGSYGLITVIAFIITIPWTYGLSVNDDLHKELQLFESITSSSTEVDTDVSEESS